MLIRSKIFVFELMPTKFGRLVALSKGFPKMPKSEPKFTDFGQKWTKVQISTPNISSPGEFGGNFCIGR